MKTAWDYTSLAEAYVKRPDYSTDAIAELYRITGTTGTEQVCDVGAGVAHLTLHHARKGLQVIAVEPNDAMRSIGMERTAEFANVSWFEGTGEETGQDSDRFSLVTFGSSFNVCDRAVALAETNRILQAGGWFACMWNHRDLNDPIQQKIESIIQSHIPSYNYGTRREDQTEIIQQSGLFHNLQYVEGTVQHVQDKQDVIEAWRSHATLERQAGDKFALIIEEIEKMLAEITEPNIVIPYTTVMWIAQTKK